MTILATNNDIMDFTSFINVPEILTSSIYHDIDYTTYAFKINKLDEVVQDFTASTQGWLHWFYHVPFNTNTLAAGDSKIAELTGNSGSNFLRVMQATDQTVPGNPSSAHPFYFQYWDGAAWVTFTPLTPQDEGIYVDIRFKIDSGSGFWIVFTSGQEIGRFNGKTDHNGSTVDKFTFLGRVESSGATDFTAVSQFVVSDTESTIDMRLATLEIDGEGATSDWTGLFTDINEQQLDVNTKITSGTADDISTYTITGLSANVLASTFLNILSVNVHHYIRDNLGTPGDVQQVVRVSATDFFSPTDASIGVGYALSINRFATNPDTTNPWVLTDIAALEIGAKSI